MLLMFGLFWRCEEAKWKLYAERIVHSRMGKRATWGFAFCGQSQKSLVALNSINISGYEHYVAILHSECCQSYKYAVL